MLDKIFVFSVLLVTLGFMARSLYNGFKRKSYCCGCKQNKKKV